MVIYKFKHEKFGVIGGRKMKWLHHYLWTGLILLIVILYHFWQQRKLNDRNTKEFYQIIICGIGISSSGIILNIIKNYATISSNLFIFIVTIFYLLKIIFTYKLFCFIITKSHFKLKHIKQLKRRAIIPIIISFFIFLFNIPDNVISFISGPNFHLYNYFFISIYVVLGYNLFNLIYIITHRNQLSIRDTYPLVESNIIIIIGIVLQYYLHIKLFYIFSVILSISLLYLKLKNPYAYIDLETHVFNEKYFQLWMNEQFDNNNISNILITIDFYLMERIGRIYGDKTSQNIIIAFANSLWHIDKKHQVFRLKANRFVIVTNQKSADKIINKIDQLFKHEVQIDDKTINCPIIISRIIPHQFENTAEIIGYTDFLMQTTPKYGETFLINNPKLKEQFDFERIIEKFLPEAVDQDLFEIWYQPIYSIKQNDYVSLEALSRLKHPQLGYIEPETFIKIATNNDLLTKIMPMQIKKICQFIKNNEMLLSKIKDIKINISPRELLEPGYCDEILSIINSYDIPYSKFQFEITENMATKYTYEVATFISKIQTVNIGLCLDDYGSGYANFSTVMKFPFSTIKLDRSLLEGINDNNQAATFYQDIVNILKKHDFFVIGEGIETLDEYQKMITWNVDMIQGYYFSKPLDPNQILLLIKNYNQK